MSSLPIGCRYAVDSDGNAVFLDVFELDFDETLLNALLTDSKKQIAALQQKRVKDELKPAEIGKLAELEAVVKRISGECQHRVFADEVGFLYGIRSCVTCGHHMGLV